MKILLVEDERNLSAAIKEALSLSMYDVDVAYDGLEALDMVEYYSYDVIIMDIMMPKLDGISALKKMRLKGIQTPVLLLTAKSEITDKLEGFNAGADDYLTKPFFIKELLARIKVLLRRKGEIIEQESLGNVIFDYNVASLRNNDTKEEVHLTRKEFLLITYLLKNKGRFITSETIFDKVWPNDSEAYITVVWVFISNLRKKLKDINANIEIRASRGNGYSLALKDVQEN